MRSVRISGGDRVGDKTGRGEIDGSISQAWQPGATCSSQRETGRHTDGQGCLTDTQQADKHTYTQEADKQTAGWINRQAYLQTGKRQAAKIQVERQEGNRHAGRPTDKKTHGKVDIFKTNG
jgi:hypothetical protein